MFLVNAVEDWTQPVLGLERHAYMCSICGNTEQCTVFDKQAKEKHAAEIAAALTPPAIAPSSTNKQAPTGFLSRVVAKICGH